MTLSPALLSTLVAALLVAFVLALVRAATRLAPRWVDPPHGPVWALAGASVLVTGALLSALGLDLAAAVSDALGTAREGHWGAVALLCLGLAALLLVALGLRLASPRPRPHRAPASPLALLFGVAPDGTALEAVRRPLRAGLTGLALALVLTLPLLVAPGPPAPAAPLWWALALTTLVGARLALERPPDLAPLPRAAAPEAADPVDAHAAFHARLGAPPLFEREAAVRGDDRYPDAIAAAFDGPGPHLVAASAPPGAGKRQAARRVAAARAANGLTTLWITDAPDVPGPQEILGVQSISLAAFALALEHDTRFPRLGLVVVDGACASSGRALAILRYGLHRVAARERRAPDLLLLSSAAPESATAIARAIGAAEPRLVAPDGALPTAAIARYLLAAPPPPTLASAAPPDVAFVALDRPRALARYPGARGLAREYLIPSPGPRGRHMQADRAHRLVRGRAARLLAALPGDRAAPPGPDSLARHHLRAALAEAPQDPERLRAVFSGALFDAERVALARAGLLSEIAAWRPDPHADGLAPTPRLAARIPRAALGPPAGARLVEPRSGRERRVPRSRLDWDAFDGAITSLASDPTGARYEVRVGDTPDVRVLVPTPLEAATPLRTLTLALPEAPRRMRLRLRGARELEVWEGPIRVGGHHLGVRQFGAAADQRGAEARALTRLLPEPIPLPALTTHARLLVFGGGDPAPAPAALHAMAHALAEVLPCLVANDGDVGVTFAQPPELPAAALVLYDTHPEGMGAVADLHDDDLEALLLAACELLECDCAAHCAACCESTACTLDPTHDVGLDRVQALATLTAIVHPRPLSLGRAPAYADAPPLRRTA